MKKRFFVCTLICIVFLFGFGTIVFAQGQADSKAVTDLVNSVF